MYLTDFLRFVVISFVNLLYVGCKCYFLPVFVCYFHSVYYCCMSSVTCFCSVKFIIYSYFDHFKLSLFCFLIEMNLLALNFAWSCLDEKANSPCSFSCSQAEDLCHQITSLLIHWTIIVEDIRRSNYWKYLVHTNAHISKRPCSIL